MITTSESALIAALKTLAQVDHPAIVGFHIEGPAVSPMDGPRGAHPREHVRPPSFDEFRRWQDAAEGRVKIVTLAPEHDASIEFIEKVSATRVVVALGHTAADGARIRDAVKAGAKLSTHLGNGIAMTVHRHANPIWEQLDCDELAISVIADGHHLPAPVLRSFLKLKRNRTILISDASSLAGQPPGRYREWDQNIDVLPDGKIVVADTEYLAGSGVTLADCVEHVVSLGIDGADAIDMAALRPRELLGLPVPTLEPGQPFEFHLDQGNRADPPNNSPGQHLS